MLLLVSAVLAGIVVSLIRGYVTGRRLEPLNLRLLWTLPAILAVQIVALRLGTDNQAAAGLVVSQIGLLVVAVANLRQPGFWALGLGLGLNFLVIALNGGLMPISPDMLEQLGVPHQEIGRRLTKDIILPVVNTRLWALSDRFYVAVPWGAYAYSLGDIFIAAGAFWIMYTTSDKPTYDFQWRKINHNVRI